MSTSLKKLKDQQEQTAILRDVGETIQKISAIHRIKIEAQTEGVKRFSESLLTFAGEGLPLEITHPEIPEVDRKPLLMVVGPERGLVGDLHRELAYALERRLAWRSYPQVFVAGRRICGFLDASMDIDFKPYPALSDRPTREELSGHVKAILDGKRNGQWNMVELIYPQYESITTYHIAEKRLLPLEVRIKNQESRIKEKGDVSKESTYFVEPTIQAIMQRLEEMLFAAELYEVFLEARYVELSQRLLAATRATENAKRILKGLHRQYLREVRGRTTKAINEIFTGRKAFEVKSKQAAVALEWVL
ncbi:MAG: FoF1 ATP synthase subunit gamma [bacterium]|nr:FoF1 ATP synthase subunit gamma [bacterium]